MSYTTYFGKYKKNCLCYIFLFFSDINIAHSQEPKPITQLAEEIGLFSGEISPYGSKKAKIALSVLKRLEFKKNGKYICVIGYVIMYIYIFVLKI